MFGEWTKDQITLAVALMALGGVLSSSLFAALGQGKSKYIETVTIQRIKWIAELRNDFSNLANNLIHYGTIRNQPSRNDDANKLQVRAINLVTLINLKLNRRSPLDRKIGRSMRKCLDCASKDCKNIEVFVAQFLIDAEALLKEEWETAKYESSGLFGKALNRWRALGRSDARKRKLKVESLAKPLNEKSLSTSGNANNSGDTN